MGITKSKQDRLSTCRRLASLAVVAVLALGCYWCLRLAYADHLSRSDSLEDLSKAIRLSPANAELRARRAAPNSSERSSALKEALALNPYWSGGWIELGLQAEFGGDLGSAERCFLEAAAVDKTYEPRWTLANYYFRRQNWPRFWAWARRSAEMAYRDQSALFDLCWRATDDPQAILEQAIPATRTMLAQYVSFLVRTGRLDAVPPAAQRLIPTSTAAELPPLLAYCDSLLANGRSVEAAQFWNSLASHRLIPHRPLAPEDGQSLTNGDFAAVPLSQGFDWRLASVPGVSLARMELPPGLRIAFSGKQPEECRLIEQALPLVPSTPYELRFRYRTEGVPPGAGIGWRLVDAATGQNLLPGPPNLASEDWTEGRVRFSSPAETRLARLSLVYKRSPGTTRIEGSLLLRSVSLRLAR